MADTELDKTIEELEAEVIAELEEDAMADAPKKNAMKAQKEGPMKGNPEDGSVEDTGPAVVSPTQGTTPSKKVTSSAKEVSGDPAQKSEGKPNKMDKAKDAGQDRPLAAGDQVDHEGEKLEEGEHEEGMHDTDEGMHEKDMMKMSKQDLMAMYMNSMTKEQLVKAVKKEMAHKKESKEEKDARTEERIKSVDVKEDVEALLSADDTLSEDFKSKAATIFEAAIKTKLRSEVKRISDEMDGELTEQVEQIKENLTDKVDTYLNYVVEEWMKENELAIERGLKGEIAEDFIAGMKQLFEDHYIDVPDEKYDILEAQSEKISKLEEKVETQISQIVEMKQSNSSLVREKVISDVSADLTDNDFEKFKSLTEDVDFTDEESFREKLDTLKESYFPKNKGTVSEKTQIDDVDTGTALEDNTDTAMAAYTSAIGKTVKRAN